jgi:hypothetical protein
MNKYLCAVVLALAATGVRAEAVLSCDEVNQVGEALTAVGIALEDENMQIDAGSAEDIGLAQVVEGLARIAAAEGDQELANASLGMANAWNNNDRGAFTDALADAVNKLAVIATTECE